MASQQADIGSRTQYLAPLAQLPARAWTGDVLGEADAIRAQLEANSAELTTYLGKLAESLGNVGSAARTVAESYRAGDAISAASLADVRFAFGEAGAPRPAGLPREIGATYLDQQVASASLPATDSPQWQEGPVTPISAYQTLQTATGPHGERREVLTFTAPGGATTATTTVYDPAGETITSSTTRTSVRADGPIRTTTVETFDADGKLTATTETRTRYDRTTVLEETTETVDASGRTTALTTEQVDPATREGTTTTYRPGRSGLLEEAGRIQTGPRTAGPTAAG